MAYLLSITLLWAFSFSLIGVYLAGQVDSWFSVLMRIGLATLIFLPFLRPKSVSPIIAFKLIIIGAIQLGIMYVFYYHSFLYITVPEVLLFTVMTPIYVTLVNDAFEGKFHLNFMISAVIATLGAIAIRYDGIDSDFILGFVLVQCANLCFATGQVCYKRLIKDPNIHQKDLFGFFFIGALIVAIVCYGLFGDPNQLPTTATQWSVLIYLGIIASGIGYFMWNKGATLVDVGTLAVMNNLLIPTGIVVNLLIWNHDADILRLSIGSGLILIALLINRKLDNLKQTKK